MTPRLLVLGLVLLFAGCSGENDPPDPAGRSEVQLVDGQAVCDSCASVRIVLSGPGIVNVTEATLVTSGAARTPVPARIVLVRTARASVDVLVVSAYFDGGISEGEFDLWLDPVDDSESARVVPGALLVTRARPGVGDLAVLRVWVQSTGVDRDGRFALRTMTGCQVDTCAPVSVEAYAATALQVPPGAYTFELDDVASNCTLGGMPNPSTVTLAPGKITALTYQVTCTATTTPAWVRVANVTTGSDLDDGYGVACSTFVCASFTLAANRDTVLRVVPGQLTIRLDGVAPTCMLTGSSTVPVTVGAGDTATVRFAIECRPLPGVRVTVRATGRDIDPGFIVSVCTNFFYDCFTQPASSNDVVTIPRLQPGTYTVHLEGIEQHCTVDGRSIHDIQLFDGVVDVAFDITCRATGTVRVSAVTTGTNQDLSYQLIRTSSCDWYYYNYCEQNTLPAGGSLDFRLLAGIEHFELRDVASNCAVTTPSNPATVTVLEDDLVELRFQVACQ